jgi:hypothetical protein
MSDAAIRLTETLAAENAALAVLDLPRAMALLPEKQEAIAAFIGAARAPVSRDLAERLLTLVQENKTLLERAITAQGRVIAVIARAAAPPPQQYGASGGRGTAGRPVPFALAAQA